MTSLRTVLAYVLAVVIIAPSIYLGVLPTPRAQAQDATVIGEITAEAAVAAATSYTACNLGAWLSSWLETIFPWASTAVTAAELTAAEIPVTAAVDLGAAALPALPAEIETLTAAYTAALPVSVPTNSSQDLAADILFATQLAQMETILGAIAATSLLDTQATVISTQAAEEISFKKCVLDPLMWAAAQAFIEVITNDIIEWIEGGFEGTPAFMMDPEDFFKGVADQVLQDFLYDSGLDAFLCEPFRLDVIFGISMEYSRPAYGEWGVLSCSLDEVFPGVAISIDTDGDGTPDTSVPTPSANEAYSILTENGSILGAGLGMKAFRQLGERNNNIIGQTMEVQNQLVQAIGTQHSEEGMKLEVGKGWFSLKCDLDDDFVEDGVCTPGEFVAGHINNYTNSALERLTIADEFSEILNALFTALVTEILEGAGLTNDGLLNWQRT